MVLSPNINNNIALTINNKLPIVPKIYAASLFEYSHEILSLIEYWFLYPNLISSYLMEFDSYNPPIINRLNGINSTINM